jgi:hypothetical protein
MIGKRVLLQLISKTLPVKKTVVRPVKRDAGRGKLGERPAVRRARNRFL